jgi:mRNA interferase RelE/StbE
MFAIWISESKNGFMSGIQFVVDKEGEKTAVVIDLKRHGKFETPWQIVGGHLRRPDCRQPRERTASAVAHCESKAAQSGKAKWRSMRAVFLALPKRKWIDFPFRLWRIAAKIDMLEQDPRPAGSIKRSGSRNRWRLWIGDYRIIYAVHDSGQRLDITTVRHRREVYL